MPNILIIDDEWMVQQALAARLNAYGHEVRIAPEGVSGLAAAEESPPDVILLDLRMPDMDGFEVMRALRGSAKTSAIPVIMLTANIQDSAKQQAMSLGVSAFLTKPYDSNVVKAAISDAVGLVACNEEL